MEPLGDRTEDVNKDEQPNEDKAAEETTAPITTGTPRRALRERAAGRPRSGVPAADVNGGASSPQTSGRVLRDRSTRAVPAWLKDSRSGEEDEEELIPESGATKRRKVCSSRRKKNSDCAGQVEATEAATGDNLQCTPSEDLQKSATDAHAEQSLSTYCALPSRRPPAQSNAKPPAGRPVRGSAKTVFKTEPEVENPAVEEEMPHNEIIDFEKKEEESKDSCEQILDEEDPPSQDDTDDLNYQSSVEEVEALSSEEDLPFRDDLNDQSYDPKAERDIPKLKRRAPLRQKEKEKDKAPKKEKKAAEIKVEGSGSVEIEQDEVKLEDEIAEDPDGPRKRGRRKKDDKTPRLPKRRKKPPVQYVRCEMEGCGTVLAHPRYLQHHIKYQHLLKKKYVCPHPSCGRLFRLQKQLLRHAKHHTDQRDYICEFCARAFKSSHNLAVHRMIHTGEKPLQCEICGFTCRQKASLNWHMKKHDADATYQFSCSICGKKFEKKDCVVAHKAKSHPEVLIAEALAANAGGLIQTPASLLELQGNPARVDMEAGPVEQDGHEGAHLSHISQQVNPQVVLLGQDPSLHAMPVPVTIALSPIDPPSPADNPQQNQLQLQMPVQFVQSSQQLTLHSGSVLSQHQPPLQPLQPFSTHQQAQTQILQMSFQPVAQSQIPILANPQHLQTLQTASPSPPLLSSQPHAQDPASSNSDVYILDNQVLSSSSSSGSSLQQTDVIGEEGRIWEQTGHGEVQQVLL